MNTRLSLDCSTHVYTYIFHVIYGCAWKSSHLENKTDTEDSVRFGKKYSLWQCNRTEFQDKHIYIYICVERGDTSGSLSVPAENNQSITANKKKKKKNTTSATLPVVVRLRLISHSR